MYPETLTYKTKNKLVEYFYFYWSVPNTVELKCKERKADSLACCGTGLDYPSEPTLRSWVLLTTKSSKHFPKETQSQTRAQILQKDESHRKPGADLLSNRWYASGTRYQWKASCTTALLFHLTAFPPYHCFLPLLPGCTLLQLHPPPPALLPDLWACRNAFTSQLWKLPPQLFTHTAVLPIPDYLLLPPSQAFFYSSTCLSLLYI